MQEGDKGGEGEGDKGGDTNMQEGDKGGEGEHAAQLFSTRLVRSSEFIIGAEPAVKQLLLSEVAAIAATLT